MHYIVLNNIYYINKTRTAAAATTTKKKHKTEGEKLQRDNTLFPVQIFYISIFLREINRKKSNIDTKYN